MGVVAMEHSKNLGIFSDAHHILESFFELTVNEVVTFEHDPDGTLYPEVHEAWKAAGQDDNYPMLALCPSLGQMAVGMGGKKNAERAGKLALALTIAAVADP